MAVTPYTSQQPVDDFSLRFSNLQYSATLAASTNATLTIPGTGTNSQLAGGVPKYMALIKVSTDTWVSNGTVAAVLPTAPTGGALNVVNSELIPGENEICREVAAGSVLNFISTGTPSVSVVLFGLYTNN